MNEIVKKLGSVIYTLNQMEVKGRENLDRLLGCILTLEKVSEALTAMEAANGSDTTEKEGGHHHD